MITLNTEVDGQPVIYYLAHPSSQYEPLYLQSFKFAFLTSRVIDW
jgi:hypothetical protein